MAALLILARLLLAAIPKALITILSAVLTDKFVRDVLEDVMVYGVKKLVANSASNVDDSIAESFFIALGRNPDGSRKA